MKSRDHSFFTRNAIIAVAIGTACVAGVASAAIGSGAFTTASSVQVTTTTLTINKPTVSTGDLMLATIAIHGGSSANISTVPTGWTQIARTDNDAALTLVTYWKIVSGSEPSSYEWIIDGQTTAKGGINKYNGVDGTSPIDASAGNSGLGTTATTSAITTTGDNAELIAVFAVDEGKANTAGSYFSTSTGMTNRFDVSNTPFGPSLSVQEATQAIAGTAASKSSAIGGNNKAKNWAAQQIALRVAVPNVSVVSNGAYDGGYNSSGSFTANPNGGTACFLGFGGYRNVTVSSLTWGGNAMTQAARNQSQPFPFDKVHADLWYIKNPPSGSSTVAYTFTGGTDSSNDQADFGWICTTGEASSPIGSVNSSSVGNYNGSFYSLGLTSTTTADNSLIIGTMWNNNDTGATSATGADTTLAWNAQNTSVSYAGSKGLYQRTTTAGVYTSGFSWTNSSDPDLGITLEVLAQ